MICRERLPAIDQEHLRTSCTLPLKQSLGP
jgi:hypothetical protein